MSTGGSKKPKRPTGLFAVVMYYLTAPSRWFASRDAQRRARARAEGGRRTSLVQQFIAAVMFPFVAFGEFVGNTFASVGRYATTRSGIHLLQGIPAFLVLAGTIALAIIAVNDRSGDLIKHYKEAGDKAVRDAGRTDNKETKNELLDRAQLCYERWMMLEPNNPEAKFNHAKAAYETKDPIKTEIALNEMKQLAPYNKPGGLESAHHWLAAFYLAQMKAADEGGIQKIRAREMAEIHLMRVLNMDNDDYLAHIQLYQLYFDQRRYDKAEKHILVAVALSREALANLANVYDRMQLDGKAASTARAAIDYFEPLVQADPDNMRNRMVVAEMYCILKDYNKAIEVLDDGMKLKQDKQYSEAIARVLLQAMQDIPLENFEERFAFFDRAMQIDPQNEAAFRHIVYYLTQNNPASQMAQERIDEALAKSNSPTFHLILSDFYLKENKPELARRHLEAVLRAQPQMLPALNNLANVYAMMRPPNYDRALDLINTCLNYAAEQRLPSDSLAFFFDTRGQIYALRRQWREASADLEKAIAYGLNQNLQTHVTLLRAYQELNKKDLAEQEIGIIAQLKKIQEEQLKKKESESTSK